MTRIEVISTNVSAQKGTIKQTVAEIILDQLGVVGDAHAGSWHRQVSLLAQESIERFATKLGRTIRPGEFGENITFRSKVHAETRSRGEREIIVPSAFPSPPREPNLLVRLLDRFVFGSVELEVTQIGKECHGAGCAIFQQVGKCVMPAEGLFARVLREGSIRRGDLGEFCPRVFSCHIITLSDRAAAGEYADRSGPHVRELLEKWFASQSRPAAITNCVLPDDPEKLRTEILRAKADSIDVIFTTGGTGVGPRDITPETVGPLCDRLIPGIIEHIRVKFGAQNPRARLSRSIAGVAEKTQIYCLPGSVRAVEEYVPEILATLEHLMFMLHGLDAH